MLCYPVRIYSSRGTSFIHNVEASCSQEAAEDVSQVFWKEDGYEVIPLYGPPILLVQESGCPEGCRCPPSCLCSHHSSTSYDKGWDAGHKYGKLYISMPSIKTVASMMPKGVDPIRYSHGFLDGFTGLLN